MVQFDNFEHFVGGQAELGDAVLHDFVVVNSYFVQDFRRQFDVLHFLRFLAVCGQVLELVLVQVVFSVRVGESLHGVAEQVFSFGFLVDCIALAFEFSFEYFGALELFVTLILGPQIFDYLLLVVVRCVYVNNRKHCSLIVIIDEVFNLLHVTQIIATRKN